MQYLGSKNKLARHILPVILSYKKGNEKTWVEPFVGGANMIDKVTNFNRIGNDINKYLISLLEAVRDGWIPPVNVDRELYYNIKNNKNEYPEEVVGFVGFLCSFGGKWWGGYAANSKGDNYAERGSRVLTKQAQNLKDVVFSCCDYKQMNIPPQSIIYCDPPYRGVTGYGNQFNHDEFWDWCRMKKEEGHTIFISEYEAPEDFKCIKTIQHKTILDKNSQKKRVEKLFTL